jgi:thiol:disulfide interchange protein
MLLTAAAVAAITLGALPAWGLAGEAPEAPLVWQKLEDNSLEQAAADGVAAVVYFNGTPCPYCEVMNRRTFRGAEVIAAAEGVRMLKRDVYETVGGRAGELKKDLSIAGPPRLLFFDRTGKLVTDRSGVVPRDEFLSLLKQIR